MSNQRFSDAPTLIETSTLNHTVALHAKCDGYHISTTNIINKHSSVLIVSSNPESDVRSMMEFDVTSLPAAATVTRITLQVQVTSCRLAMPEEALTLCCYGYIGDGHITQEDANAGSLAGVAALTNSRIMGPIRLNIAPEFVQRARETGYAGFRLETSASALSAHSNCLMLRSLENTHPDSAPLLFIDYTLPDITADMCVVEVRNDMAP